MNLASIAAEKQALRECMKKKRAAVSCRKREQAGRAVIAPALELVEHLGPAITALYHPLGDEFDPLPLADALWEHGHDLALPLVRGQDRPLSFAPWRRDDRLAAGAYGILEPTAPGHGLYVATELLIVPLLAMDMHGHRLGYGGGFFDRSLTPAVIGGDFMAIGLGYDFQLVGHVPHEPHDKVLGGFLSPAGMKIFPQRRSQADEGAG